MCFLEYNAWFSVLIFRNYVSNIHKWEEPGVPFLFFFRWENSILIVMGIHSTSWAGGSRQEHSLSTSLPGTKALPSQLCCNKGQTHLRSPSRSPQALLLTQRRSHGHRRFIISCQQHFIFSFQHPVLRLPWPFLPGCQRAGRWRGPCGD